MLGLFGVLLSLSLLIFLAYRGINVIVLAPLMALLAAIFAGAPLLATYTQVFMPALGRYVITYFPLFLLGALLGKLMSDSGSAKAIAYSIIDHLGARQAILAVVLACGILTYGGVSIFVVAFAIFPIAAVLFREARIPGRLIPGTIILGAGTFTMTALPGTPSIQNTIPIPFFGTTTFAAPGLGVIAGVIMFVAGLAWLLWRAKQLTARGEGYDGMEAATVPAGVGGATLAARDAGSAGSGEEAPAPGGPAAVAARRRTPLARPRVSTTARTFPLWSLRTCPSSSSSPSTSRWSTGSCPRSTSPTWRRNSTERWSCRPWPGSGPSSSASSAPSSRSSASTGSA